MQNQLRQLIEQSQKILLTSHVSPDADAVCSALLLGTTLRKNYPDKQVTICLEEKSQRDLSFLDGFDFITFAPLFGTAKSVEPDLLIIADANRFDRCSRAQGVELEEYVGANQLKTIIIDHHEPDDKNDADLYINQGSPATTQDVYELCFDVLGLQKPNGYAVVAMLGIISDSSRFKYANPRHKQTFKIVDELLDAGVSIEELENRLNQYTHGQILILSELAKNLTVGSSGYSYTFVSDEFTKNWLKTGQPVEDFKIGCEIFTNDYIRNVDGRSWGFVVYPELGHPGSIYGVSLRSVAGGTDVSEIARKLGGGGHKPAAGAKIKAKTAKEAIAIVQSALV